MKIEKNKKERKIFRDLEIGDVFTDGYVYLMKTTECTVGGDVVNSVDLADGEMAFCKIDGDVDLLPNVKVVIG